jgi:uncharacterized protein with HEPN domain
MSEVIEFYLDLVEKKLNILIRYKEKLKNLYSFPLKEEYFEGEDLVLEELLDAIVYKFNKIQSIISEKLFKLILEYIGIEAKNKSFLEILSLLERENILEIAKWRDLRYIRNSIAHDYPQEILELVTNLNELLDSIDYLKYVFENLKSLKKKADETYGK